MVGPTRRRLLQSVGAALGAALAGCSGGGSARTVEMTDALTFEPRTVTVGVGDTVTWDNVGTVGHSVTAYGDRLPADAAYFASGGYDSEAAARAAYPEARIIGGATYEHTFEAAGAHPYFCVPHERAGMVGTVEVDPG